MYVCVLTSLSSSPAEVVPPASPVLRMGVHPPQSLSSISNNDDDDDEDEDEDDIIKADPTTRDN